MKYFLHAVQQIRIIWNDQEFNCTPERFQELEPEYPGLPEGIESRYWTPENAFFDNGTYDGHDCEPYCDAIAAYTQYPEIYADVTLSKTYICAGDPQDFIQFSALLKDASGNIVPITYNWFVRLTHESQNDVDRILLDFTEGTCSKSYTFLPGNPLGTWFLDESKFDLVEYGGNTYQVRLSSPVEFVVYRELT